MKVLGLLNGLVVLTRNPVICVTFTRLVAEAIKRLEDSDDPKAEGQKIAVELQIRDGFIGKG